MKATIASGNYICDEYHDQWLDMRSGIMNTSLGHGSNVVTGALQEVRHTGLINSYYNYSANAEQLCQLLHEYDARFNWRLLSTGSEAVDRALQVAACHFNRPIKIAVLRGGFHGKLMQMTSVRHPDAPWGNPFDIKVYSEDELEFAMPFDVLLYEPVIQLTGKVVDQSFIQTICRDYGALAIADEMITGFHRCGPRFMNWYADIVLSGKGLAQGLPLAVIGMKPELAKIDIPPGWSTTAAGNNLCATVGLRVLEYLMDNEGEIREAVHFNERWLQKLGFFTRGAMGFKKIKDVGAMNAKLEKNRVLATVREDRMMRVGPTFTMNESDFIKFEKALEDTE